MGTPRVDAAGGLAATAYVLKKGLETGRPWELWKRLRSRNTCKTCALGMGGQHGGMVNEAGHFPEVCKKSVQAQVGDMQGGIAEDFFARTSLADLESFTSADLEALGRLTFPVAAGPRDTHYRRISWEEALDRAGRALREASPDRVFFYASGRSSNEAAWLFQLVGRALGTANIHNCSYYCHNASSVALAEIYGSGTASLVLDDVAAADVAIVIGANPSSNHPRLITQLVELRRRGGTVIVINPLRELGLTRFRIPSDPRSMAEGSQVADVYLQPHIGGDIALLTGLLKGILEAGDEDRAFLEAHVSGWDAVEAAARAVSWETLQTEAGVTAAEMRRVAAILGRARTGIALWAMGLTHHQHGVDNIQALGNLALARGWLGRPGAGLLPIRGHSNVQGVGSMGVSPVLKDAFARRLADLYGIEPASGEAQDTWASMQAAHDGRVEAALLLGGNLFASNPDRAWSATAMRRIGTTIGLTTKLNEGHVHGRGQWSLLLPVLARDEEAQATTQESMFNYVRLSDGGLPAVPGEQRSEVEIIASLAQRILPAGRFDWAALRDHETLRQEIARSVPGYGEIAAIGATRQEFQVQGRTFHSPDFATPDGRAQARPVPLPSLPADPGTFRLMTIRSEGQFNTVVYEEEDLYRGNRTRDVVMLAQEDADRLGLAEGDPVRVTSETGSMLVRASIVPIRVGNLAMYYPEANVLVPPRLDDRSRTPAFKSVIVTLDPRP